MIFVVVVVVVLLSFRFTGIQIVQIHSLLEVGILLSRLIHHVVRQCSDGIGLECFDLCWVFLLSVCFELHSNSLSKGHGFGGFSRSNMTNQPEAITIELKKEIEHD